MFGKTRDEGKTLAFKKLAPASPLNYRFRGTTRTHDEPITALENIFDTVLVTPTLRPEKIDANDGCERRLQ